MADRASCAPQVELAATSLDTLHEEKSSAKMPGHKLQSQISWKPSEKLVPAVPTWEKLTVTVSDLTGRKKDILQNVSGYVQPGELLGIMGSSGESTKVNPSNLRLNSVSLFDFHPSLNSPCSFLPLIGRYVNY